MPQIQFLFGGLWFINEQTKKDFRHHGAYIPARKTEVK